MFNASTHKTITKTSKEFPERKAQVLTFLRQHPVGVLSAITPENVPQGSVVYFAVGQDDTLAFITKKLTRKYRNLSANARIALTCFDAASQTTVNINGITQEVTSSFELNAIAGAIMAASLKTTEASPPPITKINAGEFVAFKLIPASIYMAIYSPPEHKGYEEIFEVIDSFELQTGDGA